MTNFIFIKVFVRFYNVSYFYISSTSQACNLLKGNFLFALSHFLWKKKKTQVVPESCQINCQCVPCPNGHTSGHREAASIAAEMEVREEDFWRSHPSHESALVSWTINKYKLCSPHSSFGPKYDSGLGWVLRLRAFGCLKEVGGFQGSSGTFTNWRGGLVAWWEKRYFFSFFLFQRN